MIGTRSPYWWETVDAAASLGLSALSIGTLPADTLSSLGSS